MTTDRDSRLWHPFADMHAVRGSELVIDRGEGAWVWDEQGRRYLDGTASLWYANVGHGRREIADAARAQMDRLEAYSVFGDFATRPALALAERLAELAPVDDARVFLGTGGGEAIDTAAKLARAFWEAEGQPERRYVLSRTQSYHGTQGFGTSIGGIPANRRGWGPMVPETERVAWDSVEALEAAIEQLGAERVAAFFCEPVIGAGGVLLPPEGYLPGVAQVCARHDVLLVIDSVICGFGRLGDWFGTERWDLRPDLITFAKGVTSGYLPLGGVIASGRIAAPFWEPPGRWFRHGPTYAGHATCCAAALANLDLIEGEGLLTRGRELEGALAERLAPLAEHPLVGEVRAGIGLLGAVELTEELRGERPGAPAELTAAVRAHGVIVRPLPMHGVAMSPPLPVDEQQLDLLAEAIGAALDEMA